MKTIADCMKREVVSVSMRDTVRQAIMTCIRHHIGTLPIVNESGLLVGTVRLADLIALEMPDFLKFLDNIEFIHTFGALELRHPESNVLDQPVTQLMHEPVLVEMTSGLLRASALLYKHQLMDIPVVDSQRHLVGIASRVDIGVALLKKWVEESAE